MGKLSRRKGAAFENVIKKELQAYFGRWVKRGSQSAGGVFAADIEGTPFRIECKHQAQPRLLAALEQVEHDGARRGDHRPCVVIAKKNRDKAVALMRLADFYELLGEIYAQREIQAPPGAATTGSVGEAEPSPESDID